MIKDIISFRPRRIGSMEVKRILPYSKRRSVGPFVFVDEMGPVEIVQNQSLDVLAHPHIGLSTVTYLFGGRMTHRDSLGNVQIIAPGEVNLMSAGRGIVHSERASDAGNGSGEILFGLQTWIALPEHLEESDAAFEHYSAADLPTIEGDGVYLKIILGHFLNERSPVAPISNSLYVECNLGANALLKIERNVEERSVYLLSGQVEISGQVFSAGQMITFVAGIDVELKARISAKFMIIGGDRLEKPRYMWWNFVSTSPELIEKARDDWRDGRFEMIPNETGLVPLPEGTFQLTGKNVS